jgi:hypothetical protein
METEARQHRGIDEAPADPFMEQAEGMIDPAGFTSLDAYHNAVGLQAASLKFNEGKYRLETERARRERISDAKRELERNGVENPSDEMAEDEADRNDWESYCWSTR